LVKERRQYPDALPFFTTDTVEEAESMRVLMCRLHYDGRYIANEFGGCVTDIPKLAAEFEKHYERMKSR
jgi:hypothetical protein